ncbi:hypothetical protein SESBI_41543 [Sesbania bispinosa]|nr:hypothetical protein SESBI_41543 [Sesbania bispinosa]
MPFDEGPIELPCRTPQETPKHHPLTINHKHQKTCLKRDIPRRIARTASRELSLPPPVKASQMPETEGRKSLREKIEGLEQKIGALKDNSNGGEEEWCKEGEGETKMVGLRLWIMDMAAV